MVTLRHLVPVLTQAKRCKATNRNVQAQFISFDLCAVGWELVFYPFGVLEYMQAIKC